MFSEYFEEHMSIGFPKNQLQITSACNAHCIFCSNDQNPFETKRLPFRKLDEIKRSFWYSEHHSAPELILNESLPGRISEGEALIHPQLFDILEFIRRINKSAIIKTTTNASMLTEEMLEKLSNYKPFSFTISFHTLNRAQYSKIFNLPEKYFDISYNSFELMKKYGIKIFPSIVAMPSLVGYDEIERVIEFFSRYSKEILFWSPGYTNLTKPETVEYLKFDKDEMQDFVDNMMLKYKVKINWSLNKNTVVDIHQEINNHFHNCFNFDHRAVFFSSVAYYNMMKKQVEEISKKYPTVEYAVEKVENKTYGGNIEVSGLWMIKDVKEVVDTKCKNNDRILMPGNFLDKLGYDLMKDNIIDFMEEYKNITFSIRR